MKLLDLDAIGARLREIEWLSRRRPAVRAAIAPDAIALALQLINENRLLRERLKLEEQTHGCAR